MGEKVSTGFGLFDSADPARKPAPLTEFRAAATARIAWQASAGAAGGAVLVPALAREGLFAAGESGQLTRLNPDTGAQGWRVETGQTLSAGAGAGGGLVLVGTPKGEVLAYDADGQLKWKARLTSEVLGAPQAADGVVVARSADGRLFGLDAADGKRKWVYQRANPALTLRSHAGVVLYRGAVFAGFPGGKLVALNLVNGAVGWEATVAQPRGATELERVADVIALPVLDERQVCAIAFQGRLACFDPLRGTLFWARDLSGSAGIAMDRRNVYATDERDAVHAFDRATGASVWKQDKLANRRVSGPQLAGNYLAVGDYEGQVHFLNREDGSFVARIATDGSAVSAQPAALGAGVLVQTRAGGLFSITIQ